MRVAALLLALALLVGCTTQAPPEYRNVPYEVQVPVYVKSTPPGELMRKYTPTELPVFTAAGVNVCLDPENNQRMQTLLRTLVVRDQAWKDWAQQPN